MTEFTDSDRHRYGIVDTCQAIHGAITGSGDAMSDDDLGLLAEWLAWRVTDGWHSNPSSSIVHRLYDNSVRALAKSAIRLAMMR